MAEQKKRQVGLFGGSFNPPHVCHALATLWARQVGGLDEVWWVPTYKHAFGKDLASFEDRMEMCRRALRGLDGAQVIDVERELGGESRTIDTARHLLSIHDDVDLHLIIGTDILAEVHLWKNWEGLMELVGLVVVGRSGHEATEESGVQVGLELPAVSSTRVREALRSGSPEERPFLESWVSSGVLAYADEKGLYQ